MLHAGDAGGSRYWLCYTTPTASKPSNVWIVSHGEMGGPSHDVTSVVIAESPDVPSQPDCPVLPPAMLPISLSNGLRLGDRVDEVRRVLGSPQMQRDQWLIYSYEGRIESSGNCVGGFDQLNWLFIDSRSQTVRSLQAGQVTSC